MIAQRVGTTALRRVAGKPDTFFTANNIARVGLSSHISAVQTRQVATQKLTPQDGSALLAQQRLKRPVSPHLDIYDKKQTWFSGSIWQRFTGGALSGALYAGGAAYLVAPLMGWHLESASIAAAFGALPFAVKAATKIALAWPFAYHAINGVRHLVFDLGFGFTKRTIIKGGWYVWGASFVGGAFLAFFL